MKWTKEYNQDDWIYKTNSDNTARFVLGIDGKNPLVCFGINPSTACPDCPDKTLQRVEKYAYHNGFDGWIMLNIYPQRTTKTKNLDKKCNYNLHDENMKWIQKILMRKQLYIWAAWGNAISSRLYLSHTCFNDIKTIIDKYHCNLMRLFLTSKKNPSHPLYREKGSKFYATPLIPYCRK
jgi:hypothetical protein